MRSSLAVVSGRMFRHGHGQQVVREAVPAEIAIPAEHFAARWTIIRFDVRVRQQVGFEVGPLVEAPAAHGTLVRRFLQMKDLVHGERARLTESFATLETFERFLLGVYVPANHNIIKLYIN